MPYIARNPREPQTPYNSSIQVLRIRDNASFLATRIPNTVTPVPNPNSTRATTKVASCILPVAATSLSRLLNHPNIISLVDILDSPQDSEQVAGLGRVTIWEDMTAGCLSYILPRPSVYPPFEDEKSWHVLSAECLQRRSLPEGLCWHVLRSIAQALMWLHHGVKETEGIEGEFLRHDDDWMTVLICDVSPGQIWFKKAREGESFGECKLGGFQWARVCGSVGGRVAVVDRVEDADFGKQLYWAPEIYKDIAPWSRAAEIWSLGATVYTMMTGIPPPRLYKYDWQISRMADSSKNYSQGLREIVGEMLQEHPGHRPSATTLVNLVEGGWEKWRATTKEGAVYLGGRDDVLAGRTLGVNGMLLDL